VRPRDRVVHGYGDVGGEFLVVGTRPSATAEANGIPFTGAGAGERVQSIFADLGFVRSAPDATEPDVQNIFFTNLTRCRHPKREPTDREVETCEPFLNAEIRMINPQIIVPVGERPLRELAVGRVHHPASGLLRYRRRTRDDDPGPRLRAGADEGAVRDDRHRGRRVPGTHARERVESGLPADEGTTESLSAPVSRPER